MRMSEEVRREHDRVRGAVMSIWNDAAGRELTAHEQGRVARLDRRCAELEREYRAAREHEVNGGKPLDWDLDPRDFQGFDAYRETAPKLVLAKGDSVADWHRARGLDDQAIEPDENSIGRLLRGITTGRWNGAESIQAALLEGGGGGGGQYLVPSPLAATLIDRVRNAARVFQGERRR